MSQSPISPLPILLLPMLLLNACASPDPGSPAWTALQERKKQEAKAEAVKDTLSDMPAWFADAPSDDHAIYQAGTAASADLQFAWDKAVLAAKRALADRINSRISSKLKEFLAESGAAESGKVLYDSERTTTNLITEASLSGYNVADKKILPVGAQYRVYVLLQYPLGSANRLLVEQVKKDEALETQMRASKAYQELERDIQDARKGKGD